MTFTVTRTGDAAANQTVDFATSIGGGDNAEADDFAANSGTLTFAAGVTTQTFTVQTAQDAIFEGDETFTVNLTNATNGGQITDGTGVGTIVDDGTGPGPFDPGPGADNDTTSFSIGDMSISEGGLMTFTVTRTGDAEASQTIDFATSIAAGDTAEAGDYADNNGTLTFGPGVTTQTFTVQTAQDAIFEGGETFTATLSNNSAGSTIADATATGTILDDGTGPGPFDPGPGADDDTTSFSVDSVSISEGGLMTFTVTRTGDAEADQGVNFSTLIGAGDSAEVADFAANSGTLTFAQGVTTQTFTVQTTQDTPYEGGETFTVQLDTPTGGATITTATGTGTITDNDARPTLTVADQSVVEGDSGITTITFTVNRTGDSEPDQVFDYSFVTGDTNNADFNPVLSNGSVTFAQGETSKTITIQVQGDTAVEFDESFTLNLVDTGDLGNTASATGTIINDDMPPVITIPNDGSGINGSDISVAENSTVNGTITLNAPDGVQSITVGTTVISLADLLASGTTPVMVSGGEGQLFINGFVGNVVSYAYDPIGASRDHSGGDNSVIDSFVLSVTDTDGDISVSNPSLDILITDTAPVASADSRAVNEDDTGIGGNVVSGINAVADTLGGDLTTVTGVQSGDAGTAEVTGGAGTGINGTYGTLKIDSDGTYTYLLNSAAQALPASVIVTDVFSYTISDDEGDFSTATFTFTVTGSNDAPEISNVQSAVVSEEGLAAGIADTTPNPGDVTNSPVFTGTYTATDDSGGPLIASLDDISSVTTSDGSTLQSGGIDVGFVLSPDGHTLMGTAGGEDVVQIEIMDNGTYTVTLLGPVDHAPGNGENSLNFNLNFQVSDGPLGDSATLSSSGTLNIRIEDDQPISGDIYQSLVIPPQDHNVMFVIDTSGSMGNDASGTTIERMELVLTSIKQVIDQYENVGDLKVQIVTFDSGSDSTHQTVWMTAAEAQAFIGDGTAGSRDSVLNPGGGTDYDQGVLEAQLGWDAAGKIEATDDRPVSNVSYFMSDGEPQTGGGTTGSQGITGVEVNEWMEFVTDNSISSHAVGIGSGVSVANLAPLAYDGELANTNGQDPYNPPVPDPADPVFDDGTTPYALVVTDSATLTNELLDTIQVPVLGGIFGTIENNGFGADDGAFLQIEMDGVTYSYTAAANGGAGQIDVSGGGSVVGFEITFTTLAGGTMALNFANGQYSYVPDQDLAMDTQFQETMVFLSRDTDGDETTGTVTLNIARGMDTDGDGVIDTIDIDDDNDGILDTIEDAYVSTVTTTQPFTDVTSAANITSNGGTGSQTIDMTAYGVAVGDTVTISNIFARGDLSSDNNNEWLRLSFDNGATNTGNMDTGFQDNAFHAVIQNVSMTATIVDVGGVPSLVVSGVTGSSVDNFNGFVGVDYYFTIDGVGTVTANVADADGDGIINSLDIDSDNDGIADNIEAQTNAGYITSSGVDADHDGLDDAYETAGLVPEGPVSTPDFLSVDSDGDGTNDGLAPATAGDDRLVGSTAGESIDGLDGNDALIGLDGDDILTGGIGNDILVGGAGDDLLMGGTGADFFDWNGGDEGTTTTPASDHVQDFTVADDTLDLSDMLDSLGLATQGGVVESYLSLSQTGGDAVLSVKDSAGGSVVQEIVLDNVSIQDLKTDLSMDPGATNNDLLNQLINDSKLIV